MRDFFPAFARYSARAKAFQYFSGGLFAHARRHSTGHTHSVWRRVSPYGAVLVAGYLLPVWLWRLAGSTATALVHSFVGVSTLPVELARPLVFVALLFIPGLPAGFLLRVGRSVKNSLAGRFQRL